MFSRRGGVVPAPELGAAAVEPAAGPGAASPPAGGAPSSLGTAGAGALSAGSCALTRPIPPAASQTKRLLSIVNWSHRRRSEVPAWRVHEKCRIEEVSSIQIVTGFLPGSARF